LALDPVSRLLDLERFGIKLGLEHIRALTEALGHPERAWPSIHIAGTNGKGSVAVMIDGALRAAGRSTGRYTSPHLDRLEERFAIQGEPVPTATMTAAIERVFDTIDDLRAAGRLEAPPTFFEATTAVAFLLFADARIDAGIIEVGLGGRFDATNVLRPAVSVITSIAFDHERHLGVTLSAIASEKAGIARHGIPLIVGPCPGEAGSAIAAAARTAGAPLVEASDGVRADVTLEAGRARVTMTTPDRTYPPVTLGLAGRHQVDNAVVAVRALESFARATGIEIGADAVATGLAEARWPARLEWLAFDDGRRVLLDAAHNPAGAASLAAYLHDAGVTPLPIVVATMEDKDAAALIAPLVPHARPLVVTEAGTPRTRRAAALAEVAGGLRPDGLIVDSQPDEALVAAWAVAPSIAVAGSIFLVGPLRARLIAAGARPA
jgi:dihydrofolate synthase / folylpolyglutamate synthase